MFYIKKMNDTNILKETERRRITIAITNHYEMNHYKIVHSTEKETGEETSVDMLTEIAEQILSTY